MIIHLIHHPVSAKRFVEPIIKFLNQNGLTAELWVEPRERLKNFVSGIDCPKRFAWFDFSINPFKVVKRVIKLWYSFCRIKPKVIHSHQSRAAFVPLVTGWLSRVPIRIYHNHGTPYLGYKGFLRLFLWLLEYVNCKLSTHVITVSPSIRKRMIIDRIISPSKCEVLEEGSACGIDLDEFSSLYFEESEIVKSREAFGIPQENYVVLYVGRPVKRKGFDLLLEVWKRSGLYKGNHTLLIVGCFIEDVKKIVGDQLHNVICLNYLDCIEDLRKCYAACDVVVLPSKHEGLSYSLLEGAAAGKPLIGSDIPGIDSIIKHTENGLLVPFGDVDALTKAILKLRDNPELRRHLGRKARQYVERCFDRKKFLRVFINYYYKIGVRCGMNEIEKPLHN